MAAEHVRHIEIYNQVHKYNDLPGISAARPAGPDRREKPTRPRKREPPGSGKTNEEKKMYFCGMRKAITRLADFFYIRPLRRIVPQETFRYAFVGGLNLLFNAVFYWFCYNFVLGQRDTDFGIVVVSAPILAFLVTFVVTFFTGFYLARNIAFGKSEVHGAKQLFRYAQVVAVNIAINYFGLKLLVGTLGVYPSIANVMIQVVTVTFSYVAQRFYTFRTHRCP